MKKSLTPTIGFEVHVELATLSKMFCACPADHFAKKPNTQTCPVCLGLPGALPVPNQRAVEWAIMIGLALNCKINPESKFDRKHYFYPDLPKGYQISQYDEPLATHGWLEIQNPKSEIRRKIRIRRVHIEEDTGKLIHQKVNGEDVTLVDFNRSGVSLVEIVTEPDIRNGSEAKEFAKNLQLILRYLEVSNCDMEKGSMRLEANISWGLHLGYKVEVKNLNSFRFLERAINYELTRQKRILEKGQTPKQETRGWNEVKNQTFPQRYKETEADYRYFPEPDIPPMEFDESFIKEIKNKIPQLPEVNIKKLIGFGVRREYAQILTSDKRLSQFTLECLKLAKKAKLDSNIVAGFLVNQKNSYNKMNINEIFKKIKKVSARQKVGDIEVVEWIKMAISSLPKAVSDYNKGKSQAISALIGRVMKISHGRADPIKVKRLLEEKLQ